MYMTTKQLSKEESQQKISEIEPLIEEVQESFDFYEEAREDLERNLADLSRALCGNTDTLDVDTFDFADLQKKDAAKVLLEFYCDVEDDCDLEDEPSTEQMVESLRQAVQKETSALGAAKRKQEWTRKRRYSND